MVSNIKGIYSKLESTIDSARVLPIPDERLLVLRELIEYIQCRIDRKSVIHLNFICTHNSRRSQFAQIWAQTAADFFGIPATCYSGGVEVTAFNERAVESLKRAGFAVTTQGGTNPKYAVTHSKNGTPILAFSKIYDDPLNDVDYFAAVMTCSHADENCPVILGAETRLAVRYDDPGKFDDTPQEAFRYDELSLQIASEMLYVFSNLKMPG